MTVVSLYIVMALFDFLFKDFLERCGVCNDGTIQGNVDFRGLARFEVEGCESRSIMWNVQSWIE